MRVRRTRHSYLKPLFADQIVFPPAHAAKKVGHTSSWTNPVSRTLPGDIALTSSPPGDSNLPHAFPKSGVDVWRNPECSQFEQMRHPHQEDKAKMDDLSFSEEAWQ